MYMAFPPSFLVNIPNFLRLAGALHLRQALRVVRPAPAHPNARAAGLPGSHGKMLGPKTASSAHRNEENGETIRDLTGK